MRVLALDLSKRSTGWACWGPGDARPASGAWQLGSEYTSDGRVFANLHGRMTDLHRVSPIEAVFYEEALDPRALNGHTNIDTLRLASGLVAHAQSWAEAMGCRIVRGVNLATWRRHFLGKMPRATKTVQLKEYAVERCLQLGFRPSCHDQAEAIGILDYACDALSLSPPWVQALRVPLAGAA
jgi:hypothetical protein